jgi:outer membrane immunogenic protein
MLSEAVVKLATVVAVAGLVGTPAFAADMAVKAPPRAPEPVVTPFSWTGFYVGGNVGGGWGHHRDFTVTPNDLATATLPSGPLLLGSFRDSGVFGGLQLGYNWQFHPNWLLGFETDFQWSDVDGSSEIAQTTVGLGTFTVVHTVEEKLKWFGTVRGRLGWLPSQNLLVYGTGGFAYGRIERSGTYQNTGSLGFAILGPPNVNCAAGATCFAGGSSTTASGWTAGGGFEWAFWQRWSVKAEYLYVDLGSAKSFTEVATGVSAPASFNVSLLNRATINVVRAGLNYHF